MLIFWLRQMRKILASATGALGTVFACKAATYKIQNRKYEEGKSYLRKKSLRFFLSESKNR